jgi:hypothetical protein
VTTLPTIFSITSPFSEAASVRLTAGTLGGSDLVSDMLKDEDENTMRPLKSVPATETVLWVSHRGPEASDDVLVTVDIKKHQRTIWIYVYSNRRTLLWHSIALKLTSPHESFHVRSITWQQTSISNDGH